jgi:hypothetical protein
MPSRKSMAPSNNRCLRGSPLSCAAESRAYRIVICNGHPGRRTSLAQLGGLEGRRAVLRHKRKGTPPAARNLTRRKIRKSDARVPEHALSAHNISRRHVYERHWAQVVESRSSSRTRLPSQRQPVSSDGSHPHDSAHRRHSAPQEWCKYSGGPRNARTLFNLYDRTLYPRY